LRRSKPKIAVCRMCFLDIRDINLHHLLFESGAICQKCQDQFRTIMLSFVIFGVKGLALYDYNEAMRSALYKFKGCGDIELAPAFLDYHRLFLKARYHGYTIIPAPSHASHDEERGFNHVKMIFSLLKLPIADCLIKTSDVKQADLSFDERQNIRARLEWRIGQSIEGKKVLLVDDVITTGATIKACLELIREHKPKMVRVLVMARTKGETLI